MIIAVEGNIGAGKSTFLGACQEFLGDSVHVVYEMVGEWTSFKDCDTGLSIFDMFYKEKDRYTFVFQSYVLLSRINAIKTAQENHPDKVILCERSFLTDLEVFAKSLREAKEMSDVEWQVYQRWHELVQGVVNIPLAGQIYLRADPSVCMQRIKTRARQSEDTISETYIAKLHEQHDRWMGETEIPTLVVDANNDYVKNTQALQDACAMVGAFLECCAKK